MRLIAIVVLLLGSLRVWGAEFVLTEDADSMFGNQFIFNDASSGGSDFFNDDWAMVYTNLWEPKSHVSICGLVLPIWTDGDPGNVEANTPPGGVFTLSFYDLGEDGVFRGVARETLIATKTVPFNGDRKGIYAVSFDMPLLFVAGGDGIAIRADYDKVVRFKCHPKGLGLICDAQTGLQQKDGHVRISLAGQVFPPEQEQRGEKIELPLSMANPGQAFAEVSPLNNHKSSGFVFGMMGFIVPVIILFLRKTIE